MSLALFRGSDLISITQRNVASIERVQEQLVLSATFLTFSERSLKNESLVMDDYWQKGTV